MKKLGSVFLIVCMIISLSSPYRITAAAGKDAGKAEKEILAARKEELGKVLCYGYDVTAGRSIHEQDTVSTKSPILDISGSYKEKIEIRDMGFNQKVESITGRSFLETSEQYASKIGLRGLGRVCIADAGLDGFFDLSVKTDAATAEKIELTTLLMTRYQVSLPASLSELRTLLSKSFANDLNAVSNEEEAKCLFEKYGTHLITGLNFGGQMSLSRYCVSNAKNEDFSECGNWETLVTDAIRKVSLGVETSFTSRDGKTDSSVKEGFGFSCAGGMSAAGISVNDVFSKRYLGEEDFVYNRFVDSVKNDTDLAVLGVSEGALAIPLWDFLDTSVDAEAAMAKKELLIAAYIQMCDKTYTDFVNRYPSLQQQKEQKEPIKVQAPKLLGAYVRTPGNVFYYVEAEDFLQGGSHNGIHAGDTLYLDFDRNTDNAGEAFSFATQNMEIVDAEKFIFKVNNDASADAVLSFTFGEEETVLLSLPLKENRFEGGMGNEDYPYVIATVEQFQNIATDLSAHYLLYNDLDFLGEKLTCFGAFRGVLDGNYCTIRNFTIAAQKEWGLFSKNSGTVRNLCIASAGSIPAGYNYFLENYEDPIYAENSAGAQSAGMICGVNTQSGHILNCCLNGINLRNVVKNDAKYIQNQSALLKTGGIAGSNEGEISGCMVTNSRILGAFVVTDSSQKNEWTVSTYTGGLVGQLEGGSLCYSVFDSGKNGHVTSLTVNYYEKRDAEAGSYAYAGGVFGYCGGNAYLQNVYSYAGKAPENVAYHSIDAECVFTAKGLLGVAYAPAHYGAFHSAVGVIDENTSITAINAGVYSEDTAIPFECVLPNKNGSNKDGGTDACYLSTLLEKKRVLSETDFHALHMDENWFSYSGGDGLGIAHRLLYDRADYIRMQMQIKEGYPSLSEGYLGEYFTPVGLSAEDIVGTQKKQLLYFSVLLLNRGGFDCLNSRFSTTEKEFYTLAVSAFGNSAKPVPTQISFLSISEKKLTDVILSEPSTGYFTYAGTLYQYREECNAQNLRLMGVYSDGSKKLLSEDTKVQDWQISCVSGAFAQGQNEMQVDFTIGQKTYSLRYMLECRKKDVKEVSVVKKPEGGSFAAGQPISTAGMKLRVEYEDGEYEILDISDSDLRVELINPIPTEGANKIYLSFEDYRTIAQFELNADKEIDLPKPTETLLNPLEDNKENGEGKTEKEKKEEKTNVGAVVVVGGALAAILGGVFFGKKKEM